MIRAASIAAAAALVAMCPLRADAETIKQIVVDENTKTSDDTVILIADIEVGDDFSFEMIDEIKARLVSSELFKSVDIYTEPVAGGVRINILAKDKHSWVIAPTFYNQPGNRGFGIGFAEANLAGTAKKLLLYGQIATADSFFIAGYVDPSIRGTRFKWQVDTFMRKETVTEYSLPSEYFADTRPVRETTMRYLNGGLKFGFKLFRSFSFDARVRGAHVKFTDAFLAEGATCADVVSASDSPEIMSQCSDETGRAPEPGAEGWDISSEYIIQLDRRANWYGIRTGRKYKITFERSEPGLGSDFDYWYAGASFFRGTRGVLIGNNDNLTISMFGGIGKDIPFQQEYTSGGVGLRGYSNRQFRGDVKYKHTVEYSVPMFTVASLSFRALAFWDMAYTGFRDREDTDDFRHYLPDQGLGVAPLKNGVGTGIRIYFRSIVVPLLGFDVGYGPEAGDFKTYFAVGLTEL